LLAGPVHWHDVADLHLSIADDHAVDQEFDHGLPCSKVYQRKIPPPLEEPSDKNNSLIGGATPVDCRCDTAFRNIGSYGSRSSKMSELTGSDSHFAGSGLRLLRDLQNGRATSGAAFTHPDQVVNNLELTLAEKREILASWASDTHAVLDQPAFRQLDSGALVRAEEIFQALRSLDRAQLRLDRARSENILALRPASGRRNRRELPVQRNGRFRWDSPDDDDDPPPFPARAPVPNQGPPPCPAVAAVSTHLADAA
jgi:hypothetical protein